MTVSRDHRRTVEAGYDALADNFGEWMARVEGDPWERYLEELAARLPADARVLDLGCGNGSKTSRLADRFDVVGVDVSERQLQLARTAVPGATFFQADFAVLDAPAQGFDAVVALYSIVHTPREQHPALLGRIRDWLTPGGHLLASMSHIGGPDRFEEWLGVEMFFSGFDADTNRRLVREAGFELLSDEVVWMHEPEPNADTAFLWVLARKPA
jgi:cyclopropane fatty-acyl-phospholipid synthase-like methyltransferase